MHVTALAMLSTLLVDDVASFRKLVRFVLEDSGRFTVAGEAENGLEAVSMARGLQPDLVLLDLAMPRMDGLEALPLIRAASPNSSVVVLTGFEPGRVAGVAGDRGATACLQKGISPDELVQRLLELFDRDGAG